MPRDILHGGKKKKAKSVITRPIHAVWPALARLPLFCSRGLYRSSAEKHIFNCNLKKKKKHADINKPREQQDLLKGLSRSREPALHAARYPHLATSTRSSTGEQATVSHHHAHYATSPSSSSRPGLPQALFLIASAGLPSPPPPQNPKSGHPRRAASQHRASETQLLVSRHFSAWSSSKTPRAPAVILAERDARIKISALSKQGNSAGADLCTLIRCSQ